MAFSAITITSAVIPPITAQIPWLPIDLQPYSLTLTDSDKKFINGWVYLDGRRLFQVTAQKGEIRQRLHNIQGNVAKISRRYFRKKNNQLDIQIRDIKGLQVIYIENQYLLTLTDQDAKLQNLDPENFAEGIKNLLRENLQRAKQERQPQFLINQGKNAGIAGLTMVALNWGVCWLWRKSKQQGVSFTTSISPHVTPVTTQLNHKRRQNIREVKRRLLQLIQALIWGGGSFFILGLFPYTRSLQVLVFSISQIPLMVGVVALGTYVGIRFSYAVIERFASSVIGSTLLSADVSQRFLLRVSTISGVTKSVITCIWIAVGSLFTLTILSIDIIPVLAGASLVGVVVSLASQNLVKDAINGFFIVLEDQYALGDWITVGDVGGLVENFNLRMTQLRDIEGKLITIPNSEVKIVANLSSSWARADLNIPVAYQADIDRTLKLLENVALEMTQDPIWGSQILEMPQIPGIESFSDRGLIIRVWIKTQPLMQWQVAREFRHRLKVVFDAEGITIPVPQQGIWIQDTQL